MATYHGQPVPGSTSAEGNEFNKMYRKLKKIMLIKVLPKQEFLCFNRQFPAHLHYCRMTEVCMCAVLHLAKMCSLCVGVTQAVAGHLHLGGLQQLLLELLQVLGER